MYKFRFLSYTSALALVLSACSQVEIQEPIKTDDLVKVDISLNVTVDQGLYLTSRSDTDESSGSDSHSGEPNTSPRALTTWDGQQAINDLRIYVFGSDTKDGEFIYEAVGEQPDGSYRIYDFDNSLPWVSDAANQYALKFESHLFSFQPVLQKGRYYKFLAVGRDDANGFDLPTKPVAYVKWGTKTLGDVEVIHGQTRLQDAKISNIQQMSQYPYICTEIFSGFLSYTSTDGSISEDYIYVDENIKGFQKDILLHRAVAGLWIYVTDIPTVAYDNSGRPDRDGFPFNPEDLSINLSVTTRSLNLFTRTEAAGSERNPDTQIGYVNLLNFYGQKYDKLWYRNEGDKFWKRDYISDYRGVNIKANSALIQNYIFPIDISAIRDSEATITIHLREDENAYEHIRKVKCRITEIRDPNTGLYTPYIGDGSSFPIVANSLYVIGSPDSPYSLARMMSRADDEDVVDMYVINY